jgi:hypothetical protein
LKPSTTRRHKEHKKLKKIEIRARSSARELVAICSSSKSRSKNAYSFDSFPSALENGRSLSTERARSFFFFDVVDGFFIQKACFFQSLCSLTRRAILDIWASSVAFLNHEGGKGGGKRHKNEAQTQATRFFL